MFVEPEDVTESCDLDVVHKADVASSSSLEQALINA